MRVVQMKPVCVFKPNEEYRAAVTQWIQHTVTLFYAESAHCCCVTRISASVLMGIIPNGLYFFVQNNPRNGFLLKKRLIFLFFNT
jgi:hypothetical protein